MTKEFRSIVFNQDFSCVSVGTDSDYKIFNVDPFGECFHLESGANVSQMLFSTSLVAIVGVGNKPTASPRRLRILNTKKKTNICELTFPTAVLSIKLNRKRLVVILLDQIYIYDISCMKLLHTIETSPNPNGLCDLSSNDDSILIFPAPGPNVASPFNVNSEGGNSHNNETGMVVLFDALNISPLNIVKAHKTELAAISLNQNGSLFATASTKGTIVRVHNTFTGNIVCEFRRGSYSTLIHSLIFSLNSSLLAVSSETETVHIFKLRDNTHSPQEESAQIYNGNGNSDVESLNNEDQDYYNSDFEDHERILPKAGNNSNVEIQKKRNASITDKFFKNLPKNISSILEPQRDFAYLKIPNYASETPHETKSKRHTLGFNGKEVLISSFADGSLYVFAIPEKGGECVLIKQYSYQ